MMSNAAAAFFLDSLSPQGHSRESGEGSIVPRKFIRRGRRRDRFFAAFAFLCLLVLLPPGRPATAAVPPVPCVFTGVGKIVAIGDLHGAYAPFVRILTDLNIIDDRLHWAAGKTHVVQMGDVMDRGPDARRILDLIRRLEDEAREAGGAFHMLLGNHEEMNILGLSFDIKGYVTAEQFRSFLPVWSRYRKQTEALTGPENIPAWERFIEGNFQARNTYSRYFNDNYGRWLARRPIVLKINDIVFVHGGLTEPLSALSCELINAETAREFERYFAREKFEWVWMYRTDGPLWYRDLAIKDEETIREETDRILANLGARAIVIGHSPTTAALSGSVSRLGGKIWVIDTGLWINDGGHEAVLVITGDRMEMVPVLRPAGEVRQ